VPNRNRRIENVIPSFESIEPRLLLSSSPLEQVVADAPANEALWIEGEDYTSTSFNRHGWYTSSNIQLDLLSPGTPGETDGAWLAHYTSDPEIVSATYTLDVEEGGAFNWWIRLNPFRNANGGGSYAYRVRAEGEEWGEVQTLDVSDSANRIDLVDPGIDIRFIAWVYGSTFTFDPGTYELEVQLGDGVSNENHGGIDVMALTNFAWAPTGIVPPDPNPPAPEADDWFMLMAGPDSFSEESIIDVSSMLDDTAGEHGHLMQVEDEFQFSDGTPVKFWGVCAGATSSVESMERQAKFYAKHGINMVRQHPVQGKVGQLQGSPGNYYLDPENLDQFDRWFSILKDNGIYMTWSIFYHHEIQSSWNVVPSAMYNELPGGDTYGYASFVEEYQDSQWDYANLLMNHVNPYTGLRYADDPALAIVEARNEDSIFFHNPLGDSFVHGNSAHRVRLTQMWHEWVANNYADDAELAAAWGSGMRAGDSVSADPATQPMYMYAAWEMAADGPFFNKSTEKARMGDFIRFLAEMQRDTYQTYFDRLRGVGFDGVVVSTAWQAGGPAANAANLWTDDAGTAIDRHNYFGGGAGGHNITTGSVNNDTHLDQAGRGIISTGMWQVEDKPFIMTEWTQKPPNQWKAEISPLFAFYGMGLQGWDASYQFAGSRSYMGNGWPGLRSYVTETPHYIGQFPALAYAIYNGHFDQADLAAARRVSLDDAFSGVDVLSQDFTGGGYDENEPNGDLDTPTEVLAIGRVTAKVADGQEHSEAVDWDEYWDQGNQTVQSMTDQLTWDYGNEVVLAHSEKTQGVIGFAGGHTYDLPGLTVDIDTDFVSLLFTPLDDLPLDQSQHILITAMSQDQQYGTVYNEDGTQLLEVGGPPLLMEPVRAHITLNGGPVSEVNVVDFYGVPTAQQVARDGNSFDIDGRYATYYYEVKRENALIVSVPEEAYESAGLQADAGTVRLPGAMSADVVVTLNSSDATEVTLPRTSVRIPAGQTEATFDLMVVDDTDRDGAQTVTIGATGEVVLGIPGDANGDGFVSDADYTIWADNYGTQTGATGETGDFNGDGAVTDADYTVWADHYGSAAAAGGSVNDGSDQIDILDDEVAGYAFAPIDSPQLATEPIAVSIQAQAIDGVNIDTFAGDVALSGEAGGQALNINPTGTGAFVNGQWSGTVTIQEIADGVVLTAEDTEGNTGQSNAFDTEGPWGDLDSFAIDTVDDPQYAGAPFEVTLSARDDRGRVIEDYDGTAYLTSDLGLYSAGFVSQDSEWQFPMRTYYDDSRTQSIYLAEELEGSAKITALLMNVSVAPGQPMNDWTIRMRHTELAQYDTPTWEAEDWVTVYQATQVINTTGFVVFNLTTPFLYNGVDNLMIDFSHNNTFRTTTGYCFSVDTGAPRSIVYYSNSADGSPLDWSGATPAFVHSMVPAVQLSGVQSTPLNPTQVDLVDGVWTGDVTVANVVSSMRLGAQDETGQYLGQSNAFSVDAMNQTPSFAGGTDVEIDEDAGPQSITDWATDITPGPPEEAGQSVDFLVASDNQALFDVQPTIDAAGTLSFTPAQDASGSATVTVRLQDDGGTAGGAQDTSDPQDFTITVLPVNDVPTLTDVGLLGGAIAGEDFEITYASLAAVADEADVEGDAISFRIESVTNGTLTKGGVPVTAHQTLLAAGESVTWRPGAGSYGTVPAFTVRAWDAQAISSPDVQVWIETAPPALAPASAIASSAYSTALAVNTINGSGLSSPSNPNATHSSNWTSMWLSNNEASPTIVFDLGGQFVLQAMRVWNYNQPGLTGRGVQTSDVWISSTGVGNPASDPAEWTQLADGLALTQATGSGDYAASEYPLDPAGQAARFVRMDNIASFDGGSYVGLSEVRFVPLTAGLSPISATASSQMAGASAARAVDHAGLTLPVHSGSAHSTDWTQMWLSNAEASPTIRFDLGGEYDLTGMHVWNYNQLAGSTNLTGRGIRTADVWASATGLGDPGTQPAEWTLLADDLQFAQATGNAGYRGDDYVFAGGQASRFVLLNDVANFDGGTYTGLSEIRFAGLV
jgi:hypothetical protein